jgi:2-polyprenyl-6-hydroxyphenyl methylase/3-demethylubiquinone-9 3-methyltransferase
MTRCGKAATSSSFSEKTLTRALENAGFTNIGFRRAGRIPVVAKSTIAVFRRPPA